MHFLTHIIHPMMTLAAPGGTNDAAQAAVAVNSVWDFVKKGGPMMIPIGICSLIVVTVVFERLIVVRRGAVVPPNFYPGLKKGLSVGSRDTEPAAQYCRSRHNAISRICAAGIDKLGWPVEVVEKHIIAAADREVYKLRKYLRVLSVIASVAPLMGLVGTIFGMIKAFQTVALSAEALGKTEMLAAGIYEAMITTAAGLLVAIPALICYHWVSAKIESRVRDMDEICADFVENYAIALAPNAIQPMAVASRPGLNDNGPASGDGVSVTNAAPLVEIPATSPVSKS